MFRDPALQAGGRRFESCTANHNYSSFATLEFASNMTLRSHFLSTGRCTIPVIGELNND